MPIRRRNGEVGEDHSKDEDVVDREAALDQVAGQERRRLLPALPHPDDGGEAEREREPNDSPSCRLAQPDLACLSMEDEQVDQQHCQHAEGEGDPDPESDVHKAPSTELSEGLSRPVRAGAPGRGRDDEAPTSGTPLRFHGSPGRWFAKGGGYGFAVWFCRSWPSPLTATSIAGAPGSPFACGPRGRRSGRRARRAASASGDTRDHRPTTAPRKRRSGKAVGSLIIGQHHAGTRRVHQSGHSRTRAGTRDTPRSVNLQGNIDREHPGLPAIPAPEPPW